MRINNKHAQVLNGIFYGAIGGFLFFTAQVIVQDPIEQELDASEFAYLPSDVGEKSILWLEERDGALHLNWEKHARLEYPSVQLPTLACPVQGQCNSMTVESLD